MRISEKQNPSEVAVRLRAHMAETGRTQNSVAKAIGLSVSVISLYLAGTYMGDLPATETKILQYLDLQAQRAERIEASGEVINTKALVHITNALKIAACNQDMIDIVGPSGAGKTTTLKLYAKEHSAAILIEADPGYTSMALFAELCDRLGLPAKGSLHNLLKRVVEKLSGSGRLLIIDEAEQLPHRALDLVRRLHDKAGIPIALVGLERLRSNLQGDRNHYTYLWSRLGQHPTVGLLTPKDEGMLVRSRLGDVSDEIVTRLGRGCSHNARTLVKVMKWCLELCQVNKCDLDDAVVEAAIDMVQPK